MRNIFYDESLDRPRLDVLPVRNQLREDIFGTYDLSDNSQTENVEHLRRYQK